MSYVRCANLCYYELRSRLGITQDGIHVLDQLDACLISREKRTPEKKLWSYTLHPADVVNIKGRNSSEQAHNKQPHVCIIAFLFLTVIYCMDIWILYHFLTLSWPAGHICPTYKESFQVRCDNSIPLFLHAAIYLQVSLFRWTNQNAFSPETAVYKWYCVQCCIARLRDECL